MKLLTGTITVATAGERQRFAAEPKEAIYTIIFKARKGNSGNLYLGGPDVSSSAGMELEPGATLQLEFRSGWEAALSDFYGDAGTSGDKLDCLATAR